MPLDVIDKGQSDSETEEMRKLREDTIANSPPPTFFKLRAELLEQGRAQEVVAETDNMWATLKVYASGGENGLHNHTNQDHFHLILSGSACFYGPRGEERHCGQYEGVMLPAGSFYRFNATGDEPLILFRVAARVASDLEHTRYNVYGEPLHSDSVENGRVEVIPRQGEFWGAAE